MTRVRKNNIVKMPKPDASVAHVAPQVVIPGEDIARRAYEIFERHGCTHGADFDDWRQAEQELRGELNAQRRA